MFLKSGIIGKNDENGLYSHSILNMSTIVFDRQMQTMYLFGSRVKNIVRVGGGMGVDNARIYSTRNVSPLQVGGYTYKEVQSELLAVHPKGPTSNPTTRELPAQPRPLLTYFSLCSYT
jgi:hypothetical protein